MPVSKSKKNAKKTPAIQLKAPLLIVAAFVTVILIVLWSSLFKSYPVQGQKQMLAIAQGDTYSGLIDRLNKENKVHFPILLKLYQKLVIRDTLKAGVYEIRQGMSVRQVLSLISNAENAQMNRILVIEGTTF